MAVAMQTRQATRRTERKAECKGKIFYMTNDFGKWEDAATWTYSNPVQRTEAIKAAEAMFSDGHGKRRIVNAHRDAEQRQHYDIMDEASDAAPVYDEAALEAFYGPTAIDLEWMGSGGGFWNEYHRQGVDYTAPSVQ